MFQWYPKCGFTEDDVDALNATWRVVKQKVRVMVPRYAVRSQAYMATFGTYFSSDNTAEERVELSKMMVPTYMAPIQHVVLFGEGIPIAYPSREAAAKVYLDIQQHIYNWDNIVRRSPNKRSQSPPPDDFELMYEYMGELEQFLNYYYYIQGHEYEITRKTKSRFYDAGRGYDDRHPERTPHRKRGQRDEFVSMLTDRRIRVSEDAGMVKIPDHIETISTPQDAESLLSAITNLRSET